MKQRNSARRLRKKIKGHLFYRNFERKVPQWYKSNDPECYPFESLDICGLTVYVSDLNRDGYWSAVVLDGDRDRAWESKYEWRNKMMARKAALAKLKQIITTAAKALEP